MDIQKAKEQLKELLIPYTESLTTHSKGANMYVCPLCGSGSGSHGTGAFSIKDGIRWSCFRCNKSGDIFDLIGEVEDIPDFIDQLKRAGELFGVTIDSNSPTAQGDSGKHQPQLKANGDTPGMRTTGCTQGQQEDYGTFFLQANRDIGKTSYHRGLSEETLNRFQLGYIECWRNPKAPKAPATPRLIIPTSKESYLARDTRDPAAIPKGQPYYAKLKVGKLHIFNTSALHTATKPVFIVEGELDALSIIDVGGEAVALGTVTMAKKLLDLLKVETPNQPLVLALDNDKAGETAQKELSVGLTDLNIPFFSFNPAGKYKDANEALMNDRETFHQAVKGVAHMTDKAEQVQVEQTQTEQTQGESTMDEKENYLKTSTDHYLQSFIDGIAASVNTSCIATGFSNLDSLLDGGLYEGLYVIGAISSLGKTTFVLQIADQIAQAGQDVLIFSLEMARTELMAKSISRHTYQLASGNDLDDKNAKTTRGITTGKRYLHYSETERKLITEAISAYGQYAKHIYICEGIGDVGVKQVRETVKKHISFTGNVPIVIIDYIQILAPYNERATDKQNMDRSVMELKRISRDYKTPVIGISSFNRASYKEAATMEAFKESGAIEYSSDVLIGLQFKGIDDDDFNVDVAKEKSPREVELVVLKNRNGITGKKLEFEYFSNFNFFEETAKKGF